MVPLGSHSSRTLTCTTVNDQKRANHTERDCNAHTDLLLLSTSLQISFYFFSYKPCHLSCMFMLVNVCISTNTTLFSLKQCPCLKNTEKWHLISAPPFNKESLTQLNSSLYDFAMRHFWRTLNILNILIFCIILKEVSCCF